MNKSIDFWIKWKKENKCHCGNDELYPSTDHTHPMTCNKYSEPKDWEKRFVQKFKGWILRDDQEFHRSFESITDFIASEIRTAYTQGRVDEAKTCKGCSKDTIRAPHKRKC